MTLDDLVAAYNSGYWSCYEEQHRAGISAVVAALRYEFDFDSNIYEQFTEILGASPGEKAAGTATSADSSAPRPAADPSVCEWTRTAGDIEYDIYDVSCDNESLSVCSRPKHCPSCGKPIRFQEARP